MLPALLACGTETAPPVPSAPLLVIHPGDVSGEPYAVMEALYTGPLLLEGPGLRLGVGGPIPVWHPGTSIERSGDDWAVRAGGRVIAVTGSTIVMGGGDRSSVRDLSAWCPGSYRMVGAVPELADSVLG